MAARSPRATGCDASPCAGSRSRTSTTARRSAAEQLLLATGTPILDRGLYFAKVEPQRSYGLAFEGAQPPEGMYLSAGSDSRSVRDAPRTTGTALLVGGSGHVVGRTDSELEHVDRLREWTATHFPGAVETHRWSAQDYGSHDGVPFLGALPRGGGRIQLATGYEKWGMTNAVAAARVMSGRILGQEPSWAKPLHHRITRPSGAAEIVKTNLGVGLALAGGVAHAAVDHLPGRQSRAARVRRRGRVHAPRRRPEVERRRGELGLPPPRLPLQLRRRGPRGTGHQAPRAPRLTRHVPAAGY